VVALTVPPFKITAVPPPKPTILPHIALPAAVFETLPPAFTVTVEPVADAPILIVLTVELPPLVTVPSTVTLYALASE
jgi:hypothetical protein